jgi:rubrerythrin
VREGTPRGVRALAKRPADPGTPIALSARSLMDHTTHDRLLAAFLSSSWFAEDEATPVVAKLLRHQTSDEERRLLLAYAAEEDEHARLIDQHLARRALAKGAPFWIQKVFRRFRGRTLLLLQFYNVEVLAGTFYGAMAARIHDDEARALLRRLLLDEARHIRLHRELLRREIARLGCLARCRAWWLALAFRLSCAVTAWYQARQLAPILGDAGPPLRRKILRKLRADLPVLFGARACPPQSLAWWWSGPAARSGRTP